MEFAVQLGVASPRWCRAPEAIEAQYEYRMTSASQDSVLKVHS